MNDNDKRFSPTVLEHARRPRNARELEDCDAYGVGGELAQGDSIALFIKVRNDTIADCSFIAQGCTSTIAAGSLLTELISGNTLSQAAALTEGALIEALGGLPFVKRYSARLAVLALNDALERYALTQGQ